MSSLDEVEWAPDDSSDRCNKCAIKFSFVTRRHHCRGCGGLLCGRCSAFKRAIPRLGFKDPVRVCERCYDKEAPPKPINIAALTASALKSAPSAAPADDEAKLAWCAYCGDQNSFNFRFCANCGSARVSEEVDFVQCRICATSQDAQNNFCQECGFVIHPSEVVPPLPKRPPPSRPRQVSVLPAYKEQTAPPPQAAPIAAVPFKIVPPKSPPPASAIEEIRRAREAREKAEREAEERRQREAEERRKREAEEAERVRKAAAAAKARAAAAAKERAEAEEAERKRKAAAAKARAEAEARQREIQQIRDAEERARKEKEEREREQARIERERREEAERKRKAEEAERKRKAEEEAERKAAEEARKRQAAIEAEARKRKAAEEEAARQRKAAEEVAARKAKEAAAAAAAASASAAAKPAPQQQAQQQQKPQHSKTASAAAAWQRRMQEESDDEDEKSGSGVSALEAKARKRVDDAIRWVDKEIRKLIKAIKDFSSSSKDPVTITFGELFDKTTNIFEALSGTLMTAKKRQVVAYEGQLLLQRVHDDTVITLLKHEIADTPLPDHDAIAKKRKPIVSPKTKGFGEIDQTKSYSCVACKKRVYPNERVGAGDDTYHKKCFKCFTCNRTLSPIKYCSTEGLVFCDSCYRARFLKKGF